MLDAQRRSQTRVKLHPQLSTLAPKAVGLDEQEAKAAANPPETARDHIASSILTKYSGSMKITSHLDHVSHCKIKLVVVWYKLVE